MPAAAFPSPATFPISDAALAAAAAGFYDHGAGGYRSTLTKSQVYGKEYRPRDSANKPFVCDIDGCGKSFYHRHNMIRHQRSAHVGGGGGGGMGGSGGMPEGRNASYGGEERSASFGEIGNVSFGGEGRRNASLGGGGGDREGRNASLGGIGGREKGGGNASQGESSRHGMAGGSQSRGELPGWLGEQLRGMGGRDFDDTGDKHNNTHQRMYTQDKEESNESNPPSFNMENIKKSSSPNGYPHQRGQGMEEQNSGDGFPGGQYDHQRSFQHGENVFPAPDLMSTVEDDMDEGEGSNEGSQPSPEKVKIKQERESSDQPSTS
jgi:hypothetical protein